MERADLKADLTPAIVQDAESKRVLMLAWMDAEALRRTRESGEAWFWSRSRQEYWRKGATSGNVLAVEEVRDDCDGDAILLRVRPAGPACHTGAESCFAPWLWRRIKEREAERPAGSYVVSLLDDTALAARKVGEEGLEDALLASRGIGLEAVEAELRRRA
jgi:phosphoribosyl-ATP pyrophosphohydrolase/phosphoribosyl-AMP cyclohydrolase